MDKLELAIRFPEMELGEAGRAAYNLREQLLDDVPGMAADIRKDDATTQDLGATVVAVASTQAVLALARGIATWIKRRGSAVEIDFEGDKARFRADGPIEDNAVKIAELLARRKK